MLNAGKRGFTLLELLIVIAILAILAAVAIFVLNPAQTLKEARDTQRIADLATLKTALALYLTKTTSTIQFDGNSNNNCKNGTVPKVFYSYPSSTPGAAITDTSFDGATISTSSQSGGTTYTLTDGTGWIPTNISGLLGGSPISDLPVDPTNTIGTLSDVTSTDLVYRFACDKNDTTFEINARLESTAFNTKMSTDGGNFSGLYEVGTKKTILNSAD